jgi:phosphotriesterase-related protein
MIGRRCPRGRSWKCDTNIATGRDLTAGGRAIVELTVGGLKPDPEGLAEIARATGVHIVMGCGHYVEEYQGLQNFDRDVDDFAQEIIGQLLEGAWGTGIRAGLIGEIGCQAPWTELERRVMRGALLDAVMGLSRSVSGGRLSLRVMV